MTLADDGFLEIGSSRLEYKMIGLRPHEAATFVLLHEGLGSVGLWGDFPMRLGDATGLGVFAYSRSGYGYSGPSVLPRRARCNRAPPRHSAWPQRRRIDRHHLCRQRGGPSDRRPCAARAALLHGG